MAPEPREVRKRVYEPPATPARAEPVDRLPYVPHVPGASRSPEAIVRKTSAPITFVVKDDCPLCGDAKRVVEHAARRYKLAIEEVNVEHEHREVFERWRYDLPIILIDGKRRFSGHVSPTLLEKALQTRVQ